MFAFTSCLMFLCSSVIVVVCVATVFVVVYGCVYVVGGITRICRCVGVAGVVGVLLCCCHCWWCRCWSCCLF